MFPRDSEAFQAIFPAFCRGPGPYWANLVTFVESLGSHGPGGWVGEGGRKAKVRGPSGNVSEMFKKCLRNVKDS